MSQGTLKVHSNNILPIIKQWLYTDKDIFVRELVSNACDAINKLKLLRGQDITQVNDEDLKIEINIDKANKTLSFNDTGIGMTAEEVKKYIAELAFSGAEDFIEKYQGGEAKDQIIGHFGLGFYSSFMAAEKVEIQTLSYQEKAEAAHWICDGSSKYTLEESDRTTRGTSIILHVSEEEKEYLEENRLKEILTKFCSFMPIPISLNGKQINDNSPPLWTKNPSECEDKDYIDFYKKLYPFEEDPVFWIHLNVDYPFNLKGILFFPHLKKDMELPKKCLQLYCNRVFVSNDCQNIVPEYLMMLKGVIDSPDIPLNVSRSTLQVDRTVKQLGSHISKKVSDRLSTLFKTDREAYIKSWIDLEIIMKLGAMQDEKFFDRIKDALIWKTSENTWSNIDEYVERNKTKNKDKVFYALNEKNNSAALTLYKSQGIEVIFTNSMIDSHMISFLESKLENVKFQRVDGGLDDILTDKSREKTILDTEGKTEAAHIADLFRGHLSIKDLEVEAKSLAQDSIPAMIIIDEQTRRFRDVMLSSKSADATFPTLGKHKLVLNTNNSLILKINTLSKKDPELSSSMSRQIYDSTLLSQREMQPEALDNYLKHSHEIMQKLVEKI